MTKAKRRRRDKRLYSQYKDGWMDEQMNECSAFFFFFSFCCSTIYSDFLPSFRLGILLAISTIFFFFFCVLGRNSWSVDRSIDDWTMLCLIHLLWSCAAQLPPPPPLPCDIIVISSIHHWVSRKYIEMYRTILSRGTLWRAHHLLLLLLLLLWQHHYYTQ